jgi:Replication regulatory protein RepB
MILEKKFNNKEEIDVFISHFKLKNDIEKIELFDNFSIKISYKKKKKKKVQIKINERLLELTDEYCKNNDIKRSQLIEKLIKIK